MPQGPTVVAPLAVLANTEEVLAHPGADAGLLNPAERERAERFRRESDRRDYIAAHLLVRLCAGRLLGISPAEVAFAQRCPGCGLTGHGRPLLTDRPEVHLSLSHTSGVVAAAAGLTPVAVDVELLDQPPADPGVRERVLTAAEAAVLAARPDRGAAFLRLWVRKEAMVKLGRVDLDTLHTLDLSALPLDPPGPDPVRNRLGDLHLLDWTDRRRRALLSVAGPAPVVLGSAAVPLTDLP